MDLFPDQQWHSGVENSISQLESDDRKIWGHLGKESSSTFVTAPTVPPVSTREPGLSPPELFCGNPDQCLAFLTLWEIHFELQPSGYPTDPAKVAYVIFLLAGKATKCWAEQVTHLSILFDILSGVDLVVGPISSQSWSNQRASVSKTRTWICFRLYCWFPQLTLCGMRRALMDDIVTGLNDKIKNELVTRDVPLCLKWIKDLATRIDQNVEKNVLKDLRLNFWPKDTFRREIHIWTHGAGEEQTV